MVATRKKLIDGYVNGKMKSMVLIALNEAGGPMTEIELKERLGLKKVKVMKSVLKDLSTRKASVVHDPETNKYRLTEHGKVLAKHMAIKKETEKEK